MGVRNGFLWRLLELGLGGVPLEKTDAHGVPADARKAIAFGGLAALSLDGVPINLPAVTGAAGPRLLGQSYARQLGQLGAMPVMDVRSNPTAGSRGVSLGGFRMRNATSWAEKKMMPIPLQTVGLLILSNVFMTFAWYGHLSGLRGKPIVLAIVISWAIALLEYAFQVPANRIGAQQFSISQLKIVQEVISLSVFVPVAVLFLNERFRWDYVWAALCVLAAAFFVFRGKNDPSEPPPEKPPAAATAIDPSRLHPL